MFALIYGKVKKVKGRVKRKMLNMKWFKEKDRKGQL